MAEAKPTGAVVRSGYLFKEGGWNKNWKKRFFKLKDNKQMNYYEGENSKSPLGVIDMKAMYSCKATGSSDGNFQMDCASRKWKLRAENPAERDAWIKAINDVASGRILQVKPQHTYGTPSMPNFSPAPQQNSAPQQNQVPQQAYQQPTQPQQTFQQQTSNGSSYGEGEMGPPVQVSSPVSSAEGLPPGWTTGVDPSTGRTFYVNTIMQTTQWERPAPANNNSVAPPSYQQVQQQPPNQVQQQANQQPGNPYQQGAPGGFSQPGPQQPYQQYNQANQQTPPPQAQQQPGNNPYQQGAPPGGFSRPGPQQPYQQYNKPNQQAPPPQQYNQSNQQAPPPQQYNQPGMAPPGAAPAPAPAQPMNYQQGAPPGGFSRPGPQHSFNPNANQPQQNYQPPQQQPPQPNAPAYPNLPPALAPPQNYPGFTRFDEGTIGIEFILRQGKFFLTVVRPGSPAQGKGVRVGMQIESVYDGHGKPVQGSNAPQLAQQISYAPRPVHIKFANANVVIVQRCYNPRPYYVYRRRHGYNTAAAVGAAAVGGMRW